MRNLRPIRCPCRTGLGGSPGGSRPLLQPACWAVSGAARIGFDRSNLTWQWENPSTMAPCPCGAAVKQFDAGSVKLVETGVGNEARLPELRRKVLRPEQEPGRLPEVQA